MRAGPASCAAALQLLVVAATFAAACAFGSDALAEESQADADGLAEQDFVDEEILAELESGEIPDLVLAWMVENPVSGITRVPVANAVLFGVPPNDRVGYAFVLAPILPALFRGGWSLVTRTIIPAIVTLPQGANRVTGFGDMSFEALGHKLIVGRKKQIYDVSFGGTVGFPTASDDFLGSGRWEMGPSIALGISARRIVNVLIAKNIWSVGQGSSRAAVNRLVLEYLFFYNLPKLFYLVYEPNITADWTASSGDRWTVPVGAGVGRHHRLPRRPRLSITTRVSGLYNAVRTNRDPTWQLFATLVFWKPNPAIFDKD